MSRRKKHRKSRKRLAYGIIAVIFILLCFATYSFLNQPNQTDETNDNESNESQFFYKAAIVDHLSLTFPNETFKDSSISILEAAEFDVVYYPGEDVTVDFYQNLFSSNYGLIVLRAHSALIGDSENLGIFTSELEDESKYNTTSAPYFDDVREERIVRAYLPDDPAPYFAIAPAFIEKYANFTNSIIILMGCNGTKYNLMAEALIKKGAKVCIGWNEPVSASRTDHATTRLLQHLTQGDTIEEAVDRTMDEVGPDQEFESVLKYYPENIGSHIIQFALGSLAWRPK